MTRSEQKRANRQRHRMEQFRERTREALEAGVTPGELVLAIYKEQTQDNDHAPDRPPPADAGMVADHQAHRGSTRGASGGPEVATEGD